MFNSGVAIKSWYKKYSNTVEQKVLCENEIFVMHQERSDVETDEQFQRSYATKKKKGLQTRQILECMNIFRNTHWGKTQGYWEDLVKPEL